MATFRVLRALLPLVLLLTAGFALPPARTSASSLVMLGGFPLLRQQHSLTCEASSASMGTRAALSEQQIMAVMPRSQNPNLGFRGNPDGYEHGDLADYGVYALPLQRALTRLGFHSEVVSYGYDATIRNYIRRGWPLVLWVTYQLQPGAPRLSQAGGSTFTLVPHEHAILAIGFDKTSVIANDPWTREQVRYGWRAFNHSWGLFGNMALAIAPCRVPGAVKRLAVASLTRDQLAFSWAPATNASAYTVTIREHGKREALVYQGKLTAAAATVPRPDKGATYEVSVQALGSCGVTSSTTRRLWVQLPTRWPRTATPTPSPTPPQGTIAVPTATPRPSATPTSTIPPPATRTPTPTATSTT